MKKMYSAAEIAAMKLPMLPSTKVAIATRAEKEGWHYSEITGQGGIRRVYEIPARYLVNSESMGLPLEIAKDAALQTHKVAEMMGGMDDDQFVKMFLLFCKVEEPKERPPSASANARHKVKTGKGSNVIAGDGNVQINHKRGDKEK